jgi:hypothetical protein
MVDLIFNKGLKFPLVWIIISILGILISLFFNLLPLSIIPFCLSSLSLIIVIYQNKSKFYSHFLFILTAILFVIILLDIKKITKIGFILLIIISLMGNVIKKYGGILFEKIWQIKFINRSWKNTSEKTLKMRYWECFIILPWFIFLHSFNALFFYIQKNQVMLSEQFGIFIIFSLLFLWARINREKILKNPKGTAFLFFIINITVFIFDILLSLIQGINNDFSSSITAQSSIFVFFMFILYFLIPDWHRKLWNPKES